MIGAELGSYRILARLGAGGMGTVYRAEVGGRPVALKVLHPHLLDRAGYFKRFQREARVGARVDHPNVVRTLDCDLQMVDGAPVCYLVADLVKGRTVRELLRSSESIPEPLCREIGRQVALGLAAIHDEGTVHRDLKPANLIVTPDQIVKIADLGTASCRPHEFSASETGQFIGSLPYAAPEQFRAGKIDGRADLYALGLVLFELATGRHAFPDVDGLAMIEFQVRHEVPSVRSIAPEITPFFDRLVARLVAKDRGDRFASAREVASILAEGEDSGWWKHREGAPTSMVTPPPRRGTRSAVVGRDAELATLDAAWREVRSGTGRTVILRGELGVGKTALADTFVNRVAASGEEFDFLSGAFAPGGAASSWSAILDALRDRLAEEGIDEGLRRRLAHAPRLVPALAAAIRGEPPPPGVAPIDRDAFHGAVLAFVRALAADRPVLVVVEDVHFAPAEGLALLASLVAGLARSSVLLIATIRSGEYEDWTSELTHRTDVTELAVGRLAPDAVHDLVVGELGAGSRAERLVGSIASRSDGNPLFALEILRGAADGRGGDAIVPSTIRDVIRRRLRALDESARHLLEIGACVGFEFDPTLVAAVAGEARVGVMRRLASIERAHRLVRSRARIFAFDHHVLHQVLLESIPAPLRESYAAEIAATLEARLEADPSGSRALAVDVCRHWLDAGRPDAARPHVVEALDHLAAGHLVEKQAELARRFLESDELQDDRECAQVLGRWAFALGSLGRVTEAGAALDDAIARADDEAKPRLLCERASLAVGQSRYDDADADLDAAIERAAASDDTVTELRARLLRAGVRADRGDLDGAEAAFREVLEIARESGARDEEGKALGNLAQVAVERRRLDEAERLSEACRVIFHDVGNLRGEAMATGMLGTILQRRGDYRTALEHHRHHLAVAREIGYRRGEAAATGNVGTVLLALGRYDEARSFIERDVELSDELGDRRGWITATLNLGVALRALGANEQALDVALEAERAAKELGLVPLVAFALAHRARAAEAAGDLGGAARLANDAIERLGAIGANAEIAEAHLTLGRLREAGGDQDGARREFRIARELATDCGAGRVETLARCHLAAATGEDVDAALSAVDENEASSWVEDRLRCRLLLWKATGDADHLRSADEIARTCVSANESVVGRDVRLEWERVRGGSSESAPGRRE